MLPDESRANTMSEPREQSANDNANDALKDYANKIIRNTPISLAHNNTVIPIALWIRTLMFFNFCEETSVFLHTS